MSAKGSGNAEECECFAGTQEGACPPVRTVTHPLRYYEFTAEEIKALEECDKESFYRRCVPLSAAFATVVYAGIKYGYLKPNARFGAIPKVTMAVVMGYFIGKLSYQQACANKLMALPDSYIGQLLREKRDGNMGRSRSVSPNKGPGSMFGATSGDIYSDAGPGSSLDLDTDRPIFSDDTYRPDQHGSGVSAPDSPPARPSLSYDDLRRKNRNEFSEVKQDPYRVEASGRARPPPPPPPPPPAAATNRYGDVME